MALNLDGIDSQVNGNIDSKTPTLAAPAAPAPPAPVTPAQQRPDEIERALRDEIATLKREALSQQAASEDALAEQRLKLAREIAHSKPSEKVGNGMAAVELSKAIAAVGGLAFWSRLTDSQKAAALNVQGAEQTRTADVKKIFGATSNAAEANKLGLSNPTEYARLRKIAQFRGII